jgi:uncharacterized protein YukE
LVGFVWLLLESGDPCGKIRRRVPETFDRMRQTLARMRQTLDRMPQTFDRTGQTFDRMRQTLDRMPQTFDRTRQTFDRMPQTFDRTRQTFDRMPETFDRMRQTLDRMRQTFDRMPQTFDRTRQTFDRMPQTFDRTRQTFDRMPETFDRMRQTLARMRQTFDRMPQTFDRMRPTFGPKCQTLPWKGKGIVWEGCLHGQNLLPTSGLLKLEQLFRTRDRPQMLCFPALHGHDDLRERQIYGHHHQHQRPFRGRALPVLHLPPAARREPHPPRAFLDRELPLPPLALDQRHLKPDEPLHLPFRDDPPRRCRRWWWMLIHKPTRREFAPTAPTARAVPRRHPRAGAAARPLDQRVKGCGQDQPAGE